MPFSASSSKRFNDKATAKVPQALQSADANLYCFGEHFSGPNWFTRLKRNVAILSVIDADGNYYLGILAMRPSTRNWRGVGATTTSGPETAATPPRSTTSVPSPGHLRGSNNPLRPDLDDEDDELRPDPWARAPQMTDAGALQMPLSVTSDGSGRKHVDYRMDPAPVWGGDSPERHYKEYLRNLQLWLVEAEARIPTSLIGKRIIDSIPLGSKLSTLLSHLTVGEITAPEGYKAILSVIEDAHAYLKDQSLEQAFDEAIFRGRRDKGQSLTSFLAGKTAAFAELRKQGLDLLTSKAGRHLLGHLILRQGGFTVDQKQRLKVVTNGSIDYKELETAIQKVFGDRLDEYASEASTGRRWRNASYWEDGGWNYEDSEIYATADDDAFEYDDNDDWLEDLVCMNDDSSEVQMVFPQELPMVMDEAEAVEKVCNHVEEVFYQSKERFARKGKGKGKKGKGKGHARTFGEASSFPGFGGKGGYLEHRRQLQAVRNGRGYDRPWAQRHGSRHSLNEIKAKSRCHNCKQIGHWSRECPVRSKMAGGAPSKGASTTAATVGMSTGFFLTPPKQMADQLVQQTASQYMQPSSQQFSGLSFCFMNQQRSLGTALVDTAAQHGLVGIDTLQQHDRLLRDQFGLQVQWSEESGGSVRGVCGSEESTKIAYVPIGLCGKSGVLRVQVVPGEIPFLLPAYFLAELGAVIDMKHDVIFYMELGVKQTMNRLSTGHVSVSIIEFGDGFNVPTNFSGTRSQAWSLQTVPNWSAVTLTNACTSRAMGPLAALVAALLHIDDAASLASFHGGGTYATDARCPTSATTPRAFGDRDLQDPAGRAAGDLIGIGVELNGKSWRTECEPQRGETPAIGMHYGSREIPGSSVGDFTPLHTCPDKAWGQSIGELSEMSSKPTRTTDAADTNRRSSALEQHPCLYAPGLHQADDQAGAGREIRDGHNSFGSQCQEPTKGDCSKEHFEADSCKECTTIQENDSSEGGGVHGECSVHWLGGGTCGTSGASDHRGRCDYDASTTPTRLRSMPTRRTDSDAQHGGRDLDLGMQQPELPDLPAGRARHPCSSTGSDPMLPVQCSRNGAHPDWRDGGGNRAAVHEFQLRPDGAHVRAGPGVFQNGSLPCGESATTAMSGWWMKDSNQHYNFDEIFYNLVDTLDVECGHTYVTMGYGECVKGLMPVVTSPVVSRRVILTQGDDVLWNAVDVTNVAGNDYNFGCPMSYVVLYEFTPEFVNYMVDVEFEQETTLTKTSKMELSNSLDGVLGDLSTYWTLWETNDEPDDVVEVYGILQNKNDALVELYSPPRVVEEAAARGLRASLSIDLSTGYDLSRAQDRRQVKDELRKRRPRLLVTSPPCTKFSPLQNLRPNPEMLELELEEAVEHVDFSMDMLEEQLDRGDHGLHEHPDTATSWGLPKVQKYLEHDEVILVKSDQCRFGLRVRGRLSRKSTLFATTCDAIAVNLQKLCQCEEPHQPLINGLPQQSQVYPPDLVRAIVDGLIQDWVDQQHGRPQHMPDLGDLEQWTDELPRQQDQMWRSFHDSAILVVRKPHQVPTCGPGHRSLRWTWVRNPIDGKWLQFEQARTGKPKKFEVNYGFMIVLFHHPEINMVFAETSSITTAEKNMVLRAHVNLGHPPVKEFVRLLKAAGTRNDIINYVLREFHCEGCLKERRQPTRLPASTPRTYDFNIVIGVDLLFVYGATPREEHPILNITCVGTLYSTFTMIHPTRRASSLVWAAFLQCWLQVFGSPSFLILDQGLEFQGEFIEGLESHGIQPILIDRDAPYQNGVTERRGGLFKEVYYRTRELHQPADVLEVQNMIHEVSWALQTMTNRSGYSPAQRVFGKQPSIAMDALTDSGEYTFPQTADGAWQRSEQIRQAARKALMEVDGRERLQRAVRARPRRAHENLHFVEGEPVYVWRQGRRGSQAKVGPCFVVLQKGDTVWVTRRGELWKCNKIQIFKMGNLEKQGLEAVPAELLKAKERLRFHSEKLGYVDVEREGPPPEEQPPDPSSDQQPQPQAEVQRRPPPTPRAPPEGSTTPMPQTPMSRMPQTPTSRPQPRTPPPMSQPSTPAKAPRQASPATPVHNRQQHKSQQPTQTSQQQPTQISQQQSTQTSQQQPTQTSQQQPTQTSQQQPTHATPGTTDTTIEVPSTPDDRHTRSITPEPESPIHTPADAPTQQHGRSRSPTQRISKTTQQTQQAPATAEQASSSTRSAKQAEADELWKATIESGRARSAPSTEPASLRPLEPDSVQQLRPDSLPQHEPSSVQTLPPAPDLLPTQAGPSSVLPEQSQPVLKAWSRFDTNAKRYRGTNSTGPLWGDVIRRITIDLDSASVIQDKPITAEMSVHSVHDKLPVGTENIETILIYQKIPGHPDPGKLVDDTLLKGVRPLPQDHQPEEDVRLVELGMKRSLEGPAPNERLASRSKIFGTWRADDNTEWGDKGKYPVIANSRDLQVFKKLERTDCFYEMSSKMKDDSFSLSYLTKQSGKELDEKKLKTTEIKMFREAKKLEINNLVNSNAIEIIVEDHELKKIRSEKPHRIMPSRFILTKKTVEVGESWKAKARWILLGHKDPDALELERYAPTPSSTTVMMCLQIISSMKFHLYIMDVSSAFGQSDPHEREQGPLYASMPPTGIPDVPQHALIRVLTAVYGLVNAPAVWRKTVRRHLLALGYTESVFDPCLYYLKPTAEEIETYGTLGVAGVVLLDVDDFCQGGNQRHEMLMNELRTKLKFGKWRDVYNNSAEYIGRTLKQLPNFEIQVSMKRYIEEKLRAVTLPKERLKEKSSPLTETETTWLRGVGGSLLWVGKEGRPDVGAACAMAMSWSSNGPTVDHILMANKTVAELKNTPDVVLRVIPIEPEKGIWMSVADASMANVEQKSQGGYIIAFAEEIILKGEKAMFSINSWRSHKLKRVVKATLGSEALAMDDALAEVEWVRALWHEVMNPATSVLDGTRLGDQQSALVMRCPDDKEFSERALSIKIVDDDLGAHVTDAKALYDLLNRRSGNAGQDRRAQIDVAVICVSARALRLTTFWAPGTAMIADPLTKRLGNSSLLRVYNNFAVSGEYKTPGAPLAPEEGPLQSIEAADENGRVFDRRHDAEFKLLTGLCNAVSPEQRPSWTASATLWSKKPLCRSCAGAVSQVEGLFPRMSVAIVVGEPKTEEDGEPEVPNGKRLKINGCPVAPSSSRPPPCAAPPLAASIASTPTP
eukprot:s936_g22.t1